MEKQIKQDMNENIIKAVNIEKPREKKKEMIFKFSGIAKIFTDSFEWLISGSRGTGDIE